MTAVASEGAPATRHQPGRRLRASVLGPRGGGTTRRRASDAFRLGIAVVVVAVSIPVMRPNSAVRLRDPDLDAPPRVRLIISADTPTSAGRRRHPPR
jgi:hypothetical protein